MGMVKIDIHYEGGLRCKLKHGPSGTEISTDAPKDNMGKGESFSPTDLVASGLGACMMTIMGIYAQRHSIALEGAHVTVLKEMSADPRRIAKLTVQFNLPKGIPTAERAALERAALTCPVHKSLHPDIEIPVNFNYLD